PAPPPPPPPPPPAPPPPAAPGGGAGAPPPPPPKRDADTRIFHAGTAEADGQIVTAGGRVLYAVGLGDDVRQAQRRAYERAATVRFRAMAYRKDIGFRAIDRAKA
ncbi:MAG: hypothetical protein F4Y26_14070, partial [Gammaproteobacteria bacterium]|nr:hypothetical protein [Gammaproteobacteria bacterium]